MYAGEMAFAGQRFGRGAIRAEINYQAPALSIFRVSRRNALARTAFEKAGQAWITNFLPKRFTPYVMGGPFGYGKRKPAWLAAKLRTTKSGNLLQKWETIKRRDFDGWDPWSSQPPPASLVQKWVERNPERYKRRRGVIGFVLQLSQSRSAMFHIRKWAKDRTREYAANFQADGIILPLVRSGELRDTHAKQARGVATATARRVRLTMTIPRGGRQSQVVNRVLSTLPYWEHDYITKNFIDNYREAIRIDTNEHRAGQFRAMATKTQDRAIALAARREATTARKAARSQASAAASMRQSYGQDTDSSFSSAYGRFAAGKN